MSCPGRRRATSPGRAGGITWWAPGNLGGAMPGSPRVRVGFNRGQLFKLFLFPSGIGIRCACGAWILARRATLSVESNVWRLSRPRVSVCVSEIAVTCPSRVHMISPLASDAINGKMTCVQKLRTATNRRFDPARDLITLSSINKWSLTSSSIDDQEAFIVFYFFYLANTTYSRF